MSTIFKNIVTPINGCELIIITLNDTSSEIL